MISEQIIKQIIMSNEIFDKKSNEYTQLLSEYKINNKRIDLLYIDKLNKKIKVIELKINNKMPAIEQLYEYMDLVQQKYDSFTVEGIIATLGEKSNIIPVEKITYIDLLDNNIFCKSLIQYMLKSMSILREVLDVYNLGNNIQIYSVPEYDMKNIKNKKLFGQIGAIFQSTPELIDKTKTEIYEILKLKTGYGHNSIINTVAELTKMGKIVFIKKEDNKTEYLCKVNIQ